MENLIRNPTKYTPQIIFDYQNHHLEISGKSYPEDTSKFYAPVMASLDQYLETLEHQDVVMNIDIKYFNSSTSKVFMDIFDILDEEVQKGKKIVVNWCYDTEDESFLEYGEEFKEDLKHLKFNLVPKNEVSNL